MSRRFTSQNSGVQDDYNNQNNRNNNGQAQIIRANTGYSGDSANTEAAKAILSPQTKDTASMAGLAGMQGVGEVIGGMQKAVLAMAKEAKDKAKKDMFPLCTSRITLGKYGPGYPLYFEYIFICGVIFSLMFAIVSIHSLYWNHTGEVCDEFKNYKEYPCRGGTAVIYSIGNRGSRDSFRTSSILNLSFTAIALVIAFFYRKMQANTANEVDDSTVTAADYTVMVQNLPPNEKAEDIKKFFQESRKDGKPVNVVGVCMAYQIGYYVDLIRKRDFLRKRMVRVQLTPKQNAKLARLEKEIRAVREDSPNGPKVNFTGIAFVTFNTQKETTDVINKFAMGAIQGALYSIFSGLGTCIGRQGDKLYKGKVIHVCRSHEPNDIYWENLGLPMKLVFKNKMINLLCSFLLIICCFALILGINYAQSYAADHAKIKAIVTVLSLLCSVFVVVINASLGAFVRKLARYEKPETNTSYQVNVAEGLSMAQFINTAFVTLLVEFVQERKIRLWTADGIVTGFFFVFILNAFVPSVTKILNVGYFLKSCKRRAALKGTLQFKDQKQADKLFEDPLFDTAKLYANIQKTLMFTAFYASMLPLGVLFTILGLAITYWVDKYVLLRRTSRPPILGKALAEEMADYLEVIVVCFCAGNLLFQKIAADSFSWLNVIAMVIATGVMILPNGTLLSCCFPEKEDNEDTQQSYASAAEIERFNGYDELNPVILQGDKDNLDIHDIDGNNHAKINTADRVYNNGVDLDSLETYATENLTFLQAKKAKEQGKVAVPTASKPSLSPAKGIDATFNLAAMAAIHNDEGRITRMFRTLFRKNPKPTNSVVKINPKGKDETDLQATPLAGADTAQSRFIAQNGISMNNSMAYQSPSRNEKPQVIESQQMRVRNQGDSSVQRQSSRMGR